MSRRLAVYWLPEPAHPLWAAGCAWLGRDPSAGAGAVPLGPPPPGRAEPWRYGFHATLKAPMVLRAGTGPEAFVAAVRALARDTEAFTLPALAVAELDGFVALRPTAPCPAAQALADRCVQALDPLRAPMPAAEFERRAHGLDAARRALLARWGYPHVFGHWRLHLTLTDRLPDATARAAWRERAQAAFTTALAVPAQVASIAVLEEPAPGAPLRLCERLPLAQAPGFSRSAVPASG